MHQIPLVITILFLSSGINYKIKSCILKYDLNKITIDLSMRSRVSIIVSSINPILKMFCYIFGKSFEYKYRIYDRLLKINSTISFHIKTELHVSF